MIISIIVTLVFLTVFTGILSFFFMVDLFSRGQDIVDRKTDDVEVMINNAIAMNMDLYEDYEMYSDRYVSSKIRLLQELFRGDKYYGPELFEDGIVLRKEDGQLIYPELKGKQIPYIEAERIDKEYGQYIDESGEDTLIITYKQIKDSYYYGILKVSEKKMTLSILTECKEEDYNKIQRILNREVYQLLKNRQIEMK
ncbi:MAG: hypothetical protein J6S38_00685 [Erysipelotrichaceae bacterium]|nr:hypothetical protein [Erysipelotrichaceae bacterium]